MADSLAESAVRPGRRQVLAVAIGQAVFPSIRVVVDRNVFSLGARLELRKTVRSDKASKPGVGRPGTGRRINKAKDHVAIAIQGAFVDDFAVGIGNKLPLTDIFKTQSLRASLRFAAFALATFRVAPPKIGADVMISSRLE